MTEVGVDPLYISIGLLAALVLGIVVGVRMQRAKRRHVAADGFARARGHAASSAALSADDALAALSADQRRTIEEHIEKGYRIEAIKELRLALDLGLKESKDIVEELDARRPRKPS